MTGANNGPLDIPADIWDQAVAEIDGELGYTLEFAPDALGHRLAYRERAEQIAENVAESVATDE